MAERRIWTTEDFESMSWHDVHVHGFRLDAFVEGEGCADLVLDIDYILEWRCAGDSGEFKVARAELRFHETFALKLELDYAGQSIGMWPFSIDAVEREAMTFPTGYRSFRWTIPINSPAGRLAFEAPRFTLTLKGEPRVQPGQAIIGDRESS